MLKQVLTMGLLGCCWVSEAEIHGDLPDARHAWGVHDWNRPKPHRVEPGAYVPTGVPSDAVVLFDGSAESFAKNWRNKDGGAPSWKLGDEGDFFCLPDWKAGGDVFSRVEFGDCQLHLEFRHDSIISGDRAQMRGNSGVFLMAKYELQILESYSTCREDCRINTYADGVAGAIYGENPPAVNALRKPGEWQVFDIVFHQPVWDGLRLVHPGSISVMLNGVLVQDHWQMEGLCSHMWRRPLSPVGEKGPLRLQDHGCKVHFRNIWYRPLASRWQNRTHCAETADENDVQALRRETAARLYAKIRDKDAVTGRNVLDLAEVIGYACEGEYVQQWNKVVAEYVKTPLHEDGETTAKLRRAVKALFRAGLLNPTSPLVTKVGTDALK